MIQRGRTNKIRIKRRVSAGRVVADVAVRCVERKSVRRRKGSSRMLHLEVNSFSASTISSKLLWCFRLLSEIALEWPLGPFSPVKEVDDSGEYLRVYMPKIKPITTMTGPAYRVIASPYKTTAQNAATRRKLSHGSPVVHVTNPTNLLNGSRNGCEYASTRVICGGVAASRGDFWCTNMAERTLLWGVAWPRVEGEKAA